MSVPVDARCQGRRAGEGGTPARRPSAILRVELRGGELQKLDRFRVAHRAAHPLAGIEVDERLVRERVAQDLRFRPLGDQIALPERSEEHTSELQSLMRISYA